MSVELERRCARFLFHEAKLLDARDYDAWLALFAADATYWVPLREGQPDPESELNILYDDAGRLADRVARLNSGIAYAQEPPSRTSRTISNIMVSRDTAASDTVVVESAFTLVEVRAGVQQVWGGRYTHRLRVDGDETLTIVQKKADLANAEEPMLNLAFLL
jgi:benzoate/toluate 1,2-dioxygenase subunit beta